MTKPISFGELDFQIVASMGQSRRLSDPEPLFRILIMGDFSGRSNRGLFDPAAALVKRRILSVDRDNLDEIMQRMGVEIRLPLVGEADTPALLRLTELDDFHPDQLCSHLALFKEIKEARKKLRDPVFFTKTAAQLQKKGTDSALPAKGEDSEESLGKLVQQTTADLLDQIMDDAQGSAPRTASKPATSEWDSFLERIVQPHLVPDIDQSQREILAAVDSAMGELMRAILHYPDFQELEALWRGLHFLVSRTETDDQLKLYLLDISKAELAADLGSSDDLRTTGTYRLLVEQTVETPGADPWALLAGAYTFGDNVEGLEMLGRMAKIARAANAPFIAAAGEGLPGCGQVAAAAGLEHRDTAINAEIHGAWEALRKMPESAFLGLALPRFLLRLPYGEDTDPIERFAFEEMDPPPVHDQYLWGNPAFACACLLAQSFSEYGWEMRPGIIQDMAGLPLHVYKEQGESKTKPCAEVLLTETVAEALLGKGLMPLLSFVNRDTVRLARFHSIADPPASLAGPWERVSNQ
ncbi:MAG: type VI secretion system contractile sheath large subunit [Desulfuromonadales bacterium]|nr:type VI secretion system contractile sheath large subunit [Desulfuromonadales bacterium]